MRDEQTVKEIIDGGSVDAQLFAARALLDALDKKYWQDQKYYYFLERMRDCYYCVHSALKHAYRDTGIDV